MFRILETIGRETIEPSFLISQSEIADVVAAQIGEHLFAIKVFHAFPEKPDLIVDLIRRAGEAGRMLKTVACPSLEFAAPIHAVMADYDGKEVPCLVMPRADGQNLGTWLATNPISKLRVRVLHDLLEGLAVLHGRGMAHNDLSFGNLLLGEKLWLIDFERSGDAPPTLTHADVFYDVDGHGVVHDLRAFAILASLMLEERHPFTDDLPQLIKGVAPDHSPFSRSPRMPTDPRLALWLQHPLCLNEEASAVSLLQNWPLDH